MTNRQFHVITDTLACLPMEEARALNVPVIPQVINFKEQSFLEEVELKHDRFMQLLRAASELPKTAAPPPELFAAEFRRLLPDGKPILCIHPTAEMSGTIRSVSVAAQDFPDAPITILDTRVLATPLGSMVREAVRLADEGASLKEAVAHLQSMIERCRVYFVVATLDYLARGGRIGGASALMGSLLQIKPILTLKDGRVEVYERDRTFKRAIAHIQELVHQQIDPTGNGMLSIMHADADQDAQALAKALQTSLGLPEVPIYNVPPAIVVHGGPGVVGVGFFTGPSA